MVIPPKQESWLTVGYCAKECSEVRKKIVLNLPVHNTLFNIYKRKNKTSYVETHRSLSFGGNSRQKDVC